jgi:hypothetical protein
MTAQLEGGPELGHLLAAWRRIIADSEALTRSRTGSPAAGSTARGVEAAENGDDTRS